MRYLTESDAIGAVRSGRTVEQFLSPRFEGGIRVLRWVVIRKKRDGFFSVALFEAFDEGDANHLDIYSFSYVDPDLPFGQVQAFTTAGDAVEFAVSEHLADRGKFVNEGVIQDEYAELVIA